MITADQIQQAANEYMMADSKSFMHSNQCKVFVEEADHKWTDLLTLVDNARDDIVQQSIKTAGDPQIEETIRIARSTIKNWEILYGDKN